MKKFVIGLFAIILGACGLQDKNAKTEHPQIGKLQIIDTIPDAAKDAKPSSPSSRGGSGGSSSGDVTVTGTAGSDNAPGAGGSEVATSDGGGDANSDDGGTSAADAHGDCDPDGAPATVDAAPPTPPVADAAPPAPQYLPAPFRSPGPYVLDFSTAYISGSPCGELRGDLPGISWSQGVLLQDKDLSGNTDGYLGTVYNAPAGTYDVSYMDAACPGETRQLKGWAEYGDAHTQLANMRPEDRAFISCTWYDAGTHSCVTVSNPGCDLRLTVDASGGVTPAGNMRDFDPSDPGC